MVHDFPIGTTLVSPICTYLMLSDALWANSSVLEYCAPRQHSRKQTCNVLYSGPCGSFALNHHFPSITRRRSRFSSRIVA